MIREFTYLVVALSAMSAYHWWTKEAPPVAVPSEDVWWGPGAPSSKDKEDISIRPFTIKVSDKVLEDLNHRLDHTRTLTPPLEGVNFEYGFNTVTLKKILTFWRSEYKWRERETFLNQLPQYKTQVQGLDIHYIHVRPAPAATAAATQPRVVPLLLLHGWPGSVREFYSLIPLLTTAQQHRDFVFEVIVPSLPGYGFSDAAARPGLGNAQMAVIFKQLMSRLGHETFYLQGGDWGSQIATHLATFYPEKVRGLHMNMCTVTSMASRVKIALGSLWPRLVVDRENEEKLYPWGEKMGNLLLESGYLHIQATKPDTIGVGLTDSPAGLAAYILEKFSTATNWVNRSKKDGGLTEQFTYTDLLDNVMIYWITGSMTTAMRLYAENFSKQHRDLNLDNAQVHVPTWCSNFKTELGWTPDWLLRSRYPQLVRSVTHNFGGHFAAFEQPKALAQDIFDAFSEGERLRNAAEAKNTSKQ